MKTINRLQLVLFTLFILLGFLAYREFLQVNILAYVGNQNVWDSRRFIAFLIFCAATFVLLGFLIRSALSSREFLPILNKIREIPGWLRTLSALVLPIIPGVIKWFAPLPETIDLGFWTSFFLMHCAGLASAWLVGGKDRSITDFVLSIGSYWLASGAFYAAFSKLVFVTGYPFPLYWSEGNRFFDFSTLFGSFRYNLPGNGDIYAFINWGMQLPWAIPFIIPGLTIGVFRLWYQLVWILPPVALGAAAFITFRGKAKVGAASVVFGLWAFTFLDQGPIYIPLVLSAILIMFALRMRLLPAALVVAIASFYAHESRWTWSYAPGLWAGLGSLLMIENLSFKREKIRDFTRPVVLGLAGLFGGRILPELPDILSGSEAAAVQVLPDISRSVTRQPLLWDRLCPNSTYPPGILLGILWASLPLIIFLVVLGAQKVWKPNWLKTTASVVVAAAFFAAGLTASVKIGGGSNLHNLDMFLVTLVLLAARAGASFHEKFMGKTNVNFWLTMLAVVALVFPITYALRPSGKPNLPAEEEVTASLAAIREQIAQVPDNGEILFIDHRQLLTFGLVPQVNLVDEYEKKKLMDEALSGNAAYFAPFFDDIREQRFDLIINEPLNVIIRGEDYAFGDENDAYVKWVTIPLTCGYEAVYTNSETGVELLIPSEAYPEFLNCEQVLSSDFSQ